MTIQEEIKRQKEIIENATAPFTHHKGSMLWITDKGGSAKFLQQFGNREFICESSTCWPRVLKALEVAYNGLIDERLHLRDPEKTVFDVESVLNEIEQILKGEGDETR